MAAGLAMAGVMLSAPASAIAEAEVRFVHALPGAGAAAATVEGREVATGLGFGEASGYVSVRGGETALGLTTGDRRAEASARLADGTRSTVITAEGESLIVLRDGRARAGEARVRVVNAAAELGTPDVSLGEQPLAEGLELGQAGDYLTADPGTYSLRATRAGGEGEGEGDPLVSGHSISLAAGTTSTALLIGTGGEPARFLVLEDAAFTPRGAPATGLGGLSGDRGPVWLLVLAAATLAGTLGGLAHRLTTRRDSAAGEPPRR